MSEKRKRRHLVERWILKHSTRAEFADEIEVSQPFLCYILNYKRGVSLDLADRIRCATNNEIQFHDLLRENRRVPSRAANLIQL